MSTNEVRSILDLTDEELKSISQTNILPDAVNLTKLESREDFTTVFKLRYSPKRLADYLLRERGVTGGKAYTTSYQSTIPVEVRQRRLDHKEAELELRRNKQTNQTLIWGKVQDIESEVKALRKELRELITILTKERR